MKQVIIRGIVHFDESVETYELQEINILLRMSFDIDCFCEPSNYFIEMEFNGTYLIAICVFISTILNVIFFLVIISINIMVIYSLLTNRVNKLTVL